MIIQQLVRIGSLYDTDQYSALIEQSYKGNPQLIAVLECDIWNNDAPLLPKSYEFRDEERNLYALGYAPGNALPSINHPIDFAKWVSAKEDTASAKKLKGKSQLGRIVGRTKESKDAIISQLHNWLFLNLDRIYNAVSEYLLITNEFNAKSAPKWLVLKILDSAKGGECRWPGELQPLKDIFIKAFSGKKTSGTTDALCHGCGNPSDSSSSFAGTNMFTVDQVGYSMGLHPKDTMQFQLCETCTTQATVGMNKVDSEMTFYAYSIKSGRSKIPVKYQIIPNADRATSLEQCINAIMRISRKDQVRAIESLDGALEKAERKRDNVELSEALSVLPHKLSYTIVFFSEAAQSRMKNIVGSYFFPGTRLKEIKSILRDLADGFGLSRITEIKTQRLYHLMGPKVFPSFLASLFLGTSVDRRLLLRAGATYRPDDREDTIRHMFLEMIRETDRSSRSTGQNFVGSKVRNLLTLHDTLYYHNLLGGKIS